MTLKTKVLTSIPIFFFVFLIFSLFHYSYAQSPVIISFNSDIEIQKEGTLLIEEKIDVDFGSEQKHGLVREITYKITNEDGDRLKFGIEILDISDGQGNKYNFSSAKINDYIELKIGDPDKLITGQKTYVIKYRVSGGITYFTDHDELYWNLSGNYWNYPIESFTSRIELPEGTNEENIKYICYEGNDTSEEQTCDVMYENGFIYASSSRLLVPGEGITAGVSFPKGLVAVLEPEKDDMSLISKIFLGLLVLLASLWYLVLPLKIFINSLKEKKFIRQNEKIVAAWFESPQYDNGDAFTPAETGFILDKKIDHQELTATIIHLAQRGYLKIREDSKNDFSFIKAKSIDSPELRDFEKKVLEAIFEKGDEVRDTDLKKSTTLFNKISDFNKKVEDSLMKEKMFEQKPSSIDIKNMIFTGIGFTTFNFLLGFTALLFGKGSAKRTLNGVQKYSEAKSLLNFIKSQDEQLNFQANNQMFFEKLLPYAAAFGVEKIWAERFKDLSMAKPDWYEGNSFTNAAFVSGMTRNIGGSVRSATASSMSSTRSSSGFSSGFSGGHSGGGGGGGGGGGW